MENLDNLKAVRELFVQRRRGAMSQLVRVMDKEPAHIEKLFDKFQRAHAAVELIDRVSDDEKRMPA